MVSHPEMSRDIKHVTKVYHEFKRSSTKVKSLCTEWPSYPPDPLICVSGQARVSYWPAAFKMPQQGQNTAPGRPVFHPAAASFLPAQAEESFILNHEAKAYRLKGE